MPRYLRVLAPAVLLAATLAALIAGLTIGGAGAERALLDPGAIVRYGMPISRTLVNVAMAGMIGALVTAVWALSDTKPEFRLTMDFAAASAAILAVSAVATMLFTYIDVSGLPFSADAAFGAGLAQFITEIELGTLWLVQILLAAVTTVICFAVRDRRMTLVALIAALATTLPLAEQGHAAGASGHALAVNALLLHLMGAAVWLGGLLLLVFLSRVVDEQRLGVLTARYSSLALFAFIGVAVSGVVSGLLRIRSLDDLFGTGYGQLIILKTVALVGLGIFGAIQRRWLIPSISGEQPVGATGIARKIHGRAFLWFVIAELAVMGAASGFAGALGRSETPRVIESARDSGDTVPPAEWLTGDPLPPELTFSSYFTEWKFDIAWVLVSVVGAVLYLGAVVRLARRGDRWPVLRTIAWMSGLVVLAYTTNGAFNAYERYLFSLHMLGHMLFTMLIPLLLVLGAPTTLLLRAVKKRKDGSWGAREWVMWAIQTPYAKFITHPAVAAVVFVGSLWVFYFTPIFRWAMVEHLGHQWMIIHFLISGYLFALSMIGIDPVPYRFPHALRIVTLFATMASHAFFGVTIMTGDGLLLADWFGAMGREWGLPPVEDQHLGGGIAWGIGEIPTLMLALVVAIQWSRSDTKEQKRRDRAADRSGEAELHAYNEMLRKQADRDEALAKRGRRS